MDGYSQVQSETTSERERKRNQSNSEGSSLLGSSATLASTNKTAQGSPPIDSWDDSLVPHHGSKRSEHSTSEQAIRDGDIVVEQTRTKTEILIPRPWPIS
jgi:hypothetical protein